MVNTKKEEISTEERIMEAAIKIFTEKGMDGARMQDIADEAQVNKAMVHYYYRNKSRLFKMIFSKKIKELFGAFESILKGDMTFEEKIKAFVKTEIEMLSRFPSIPLFVLNEASKNPTVLDEVFETGGPKYLKDIFSILVEREISAGTIRSVDSNQLLINVMSLCIYPFVAKPILKFVLNQDEKQYSLMIEERKEQVANLILNDIIINPK